MSEESKELDKVKNTAVGMPVDMAELEADSGKGGDLGMKDVAIPYCYILQPNSPQINVDSPKYIQGATSSMLYFTVLEELVASRDGNGVYTIPCFYERVINEWRDRDAGGGLVRSYPADDAIMQQAQPDKDNKMRLPNGNQLIDTAYHYNMFLVDERWHQVIFPLKSTALKYSRRLNSNLKTTMIPGTQKVAPRWLFQYFLSTVKEQKDTYTWSSPVFTQKEMVTREQYAAAKQFAEIAGSELLRQKVREGDVQGVEQKELPF
jgi:hypothetical protein